MSDNLGTYGANLALAALLNGPAQLYLGLHVSDPDVLDPSPTELAGLGYQRQPIDFATVSGRNGVSNVDCNYSGVPGATITFLGVWTQVGSGMLIFCKDISATPIVTIAGGFVYVPAGDIALGFPHAA